MFTALRRQPLRVAIIFGVLVFLFMSAKLLRWMSMAPAYGTLDPSDRFDGHFTKISVEMCVGEVEQYKGTALEQGTIGSGVCLCAPGVPCIGSGCTDAGPPPPTPVETCATDWGGHDTPCSRRRPKCNGYVPGKSWGHCKSLPAFMYNPVICPKCRCGHTVPQIHDLSAPEQLLARVWREVLFRDPTIDEQAEYYPEIENGELEEPDLVAEACLLASKLVVPIPHRCSLSSSKKRPWSTRMAGKVYLWAVDYHSAPVACNIPIYRDAGAVVHAEIDYGNCVYAGTCKKRLRLLSCDGNLGFALKTSAYSDPNSLIKAFGESYKNDEEFQRVNGFICSHPVANCELFMQFNKPIVIFATTRLEFGRDDRYVDWRLSDWNKDEGSRRWKTWVNNLLTIAADKRNTIAANNLYDVKYIEYHTGLKAMLLESWCGDKTDNYWNLVHGSHGSADDSTAYNPSEQQHTVLIGAYRTNLDRDRFIDTQDMRSPKEKFESHPIMISMRDAAKHSSLYKFKTIAEEYPKGYSNGNLSTHPAIVVIPYQVSTMNLFEMYRLGIPLFFPSLDLLCTWYEKHHILWERQYGTPKRLADIIGGNTTWPDPNSESVESFRFWVKWSDWYVWPHIQYFDSWEDLVSKMNTMNIDRLRSISAEMSTHNQQKREELVRNWSEVFAKMQ